MRLKIILISLILTFGFIAGAYIAIAKGVPPISELKKYRFIEGTKVYADDDTLIGEFKIEKGIYVPLKDIPPHLKNAVVATEDSRFWKHKGIDYLGIGRALIKDILSASLKEGGSTITQQLAKIMFLSSEKTIQRKIKEAQLAIKLEKELSKEEILELYLNKVYFGHGAYGVEMASRLYFGKPVNRITLAESAILAGLIKAPNTYSPYNNLVKAKERQETVLKRMEEEGFIKPSEAEKAKKEPIFLSSFNTNTDSYNYFLEYIRDILEQKYGIEMIYKGNLRVYTTLNKKAQLSAQKALQEGLREVDKRKGWRGPLGNKADIKDDLQTPKTSFHPFVGDISTGIVLSVGPKEATIKARGLTGKLMLADAIWASTVIDKNSGKIKTIKNLKLTDILRKGDIIQVKFKNISGNNILFSLEQEPEIEGAVVIMEPETGFIKALVGGNNFNKSPFNRAVYAKRQPGSAFKPVIYAAALEHGFTPATVINDEPVSYPGVNGQPWTPENYDHKYYGPTTLRTALAFSRNIVTVKLLDSVGIDKVISFAKKIGINSEIPRELTIALGSVTMTPLELATVYSTFANGGIKIEPIAIRYITDSKGTVLESNEPEGDEVVSPETSFLITSMMKDVISYGTGMRANIGRPAAGKTGTSNDYKDAWFVGYTPQLVGCVWIGFDDMRKSLGAGEVGGRVAAPIWSRFMREILNDESPKDFAIPDGITKYIIDEASSYYEYFKDGTTPKDLNKIPLKFEKPQIEYD
jgi:penicillin-binding protein 1A